MPSMLSGPGGQPAARDSRSAWPIGPKSAQALEDVAIDARLFAGVTFDRAVERNSTTSRPSNPSSTAVRFDIVFRNSAAPAMSGIETAICKAMSTRPAPSRGELPTVCLSSPMTRERVRKARGSRR